MAFRFQTNHSRFGNRLLLGHCCHSDFGGQAEEEGGRLRSLLDPRPTERGHIDQVVGILEGRDTVAAVAVAGSAQYEDCCTRIAEEVIGLECRGHLRLVQMVLVVDGAWVRLSGLELALWLKEYVARRDVVVVVALRGLSRVSVGDRSR